MRVVVLGLVLTSFLPAPARARSRAVDEEERPYDRGEMPRHADRTHFEQLRQNGLLRRMPGPFRPWLAGASLAIDPGSGEVFIADTDNGTVAVSDAGGARVVRVIPVGAAPEQVVVAPGGRAFVTVRDAGDVVRIDPQAHAVGARVHLGGEPFGAALAADGRTLFVTLAARGAVVALDTATLVERRRVRLDPDPRGMAATPDGDKLFVTHLTGRALSVVDLGTGAVRRVALSDGEGFFGAPRQPNLAFAIAISPSGRRVYVPHVLADTGQDVRPEVRSASYGAGTSEPIVATLSTIDAEAEEASDRVLPALLAEISQPRALAVDPEHMRVFVLGFGSDEVRVVDVARGMLNLGSIALPRQSGPKAVALSADGRRLYVHASFRHALEVARIDGVSMSPVTELPIGEERWPAAAVRGRALFFAGGDMRVSRGGQLACGSCHPEGRQDGLTWRLDKGPRQTPILAGRLAGTAPYNWLGTGHSLTDNMKDTMGRLGGTGLPRRALADLELFMTRYLDAVPAPERRTPVELVTRGRELFHADDVGCANCHTPGAFTDGKNHDVGTTTSEELARLRFERGEPPPETESPLTRFAASVVQAAPAQLLRALGGRPGATTRRPGRSELNELMMALVFAVEGTRLVPDPDASVIRMGRRRHGPAVKPPLRLAYNTPSLVRVSAGAPYFHDGSAKTLRDVLTTGNPGDRMGRTSHLSPADVDALVAYLETL